MQDDLIEAMAENIRYDPRTPWIADSDLTFIARAAYAVITDRIATLEAKLAEKDALIEHAGGDGVTEGDRDAAKSLLGRDDVGPSWWSIDSGNADNDRLVQAFARHRQAAFADGFTAALQGAEAAIWRIEDDSFLYENVSKALQEVISELQAMEQNWTGRATIEHRQAAIKQRDAEIERLRGALGLIIENESADTGYGNSSAKIARAALGDWKPEAGDLGGDHVR